MTDSRPPPPPLFFFFSSFFFIPSPHCRLPSKASPMINSRVLGKECPPLRPTTNRDETNERVSERTNCLGKSEKARTADCQGTRTRPPSLRKTPHRGGLKERARGVLGTRVPQRLRLSETGEVASSCFCLSLWPPSLSLSWPFSGHTSQQGHSLPLRRPQSSKQNDFLSPPVAGLERGTQKKSRGQASVTP